MKVLCIDASKQAVNTPRVQENELYTVIKEFKRNDELMYNLEEVGESDDFFYAWRFIPISDVSEKDMAAKRRLPLISS